MPEQFFIQIAGPERKWWFRASFGTSPSLKTPFLPSGSQPQFELRSLNWLYSTCSKSRLYSWCVHIERKSKEVISGDRLGQAMFNSSGPPLPMQRQGNVSVSELRTFFDKWGGAPSCIRMISGEFSKRIDCSLKFCWRISRFELPFTICSRKKGPITARYPIAAQNITLDCSATSRFSIQDCFRINVS